MKTSKTIWSGVLAVATLAACGGGGGGGSSSSTTNATATNNGTTQPAGITSLTGVKGFKVNYTPNFSSATAWTGQVTSPITYTRTTDLNNFAVADGASPAKTYSQTGPTGISAGQFASINGTNFGGTTYTYSRFGWLYGSVTETDSSTTAWYTPFAFASTTPTSPTNLSYVGTQQALVYLQGDKNSTVPGISGYATCDTSASYTSSSKSLQLTLSNCTTGVSSFSISGGLTLANGTGTTTLTAQQPQGNLQTMTATSVDSGNFLLAGPNGEELVGAATIKGTIASSSGTSSNPAIFFVIFGGKKQ